MANQAQASGSDFFNLHVSGIGYLNRVRWVDLNRGRGGRRTEPFLCCGVNALHGSTNDPNRTSFDFKVSGEENIELINSLAEAVDNRQKVLITFKAGDIYPHMYERNARDEQGRDTGHKEVAAIIKGRLIRINTVKVNGELVYKRLDSESEEGGQPVDEAIESAAMQEEMAEQPAVEPQRPTAVRPVQGRAAPENRAQTPRRTQYAQA